MTLGDGSPSAPDASHAPDAQHARRAWLRPVVATTLVTAVVTAASWLLPAKYAATGVGLCFLFATWLLVLRRDDAEVRAHGLALAGLFEPSRLDPKRIAREAGLACAFALVMALIVFPPFVAGYPLYWSRIVGHPLHWVGKPLLLPPKFLDDVLGQLLVIALPEEAFFRGYLQTSLDRVFPRRARLLGADVGASLVVTSAVFAVGHLLTDPHPARLAVFFPSLLFGWMRARSGGIGASLIFHAMCNLFVTVLAGNFGLGGGR